MTLREIRNRAVIKMEEEATKLKGKKEKLTARHLECQQKLFDTAKELKRKDNSHPLIAKTEELKKEISSLVSSIRHTDIRLSRVNNRIERFKRGRR